MGGQVNGKFIAVGDAKISQESGDGFARWVLIRLENTQASATNSLSFHDLIERFDGFRDTGMAAFVANRFNHRNLGLQDFRS